MKKHLKLIIAIALISIIGYLGYSITAKLNYKKEVAERIKTIPAFSFKTLEGTVFTDKEVDSAKPKLFIYFNSECDYCQAEAQQIQANLEQLKEVQLLFVSFEEKDKIRGFAKKYSLLNVENTLFLEDEKMTFAVLFDAKSIPFMLLYSKDNKLIQKFKGVTKIKKIIAHLPSSQREETK